MLDLGLDRRLELRARGDISEKVQTDKGTGSYPLRDIVKQGRHVAHMCAGEHGVEHLALLLVGCAICR